MLRVGPRFMTVSTPVAHCSIDCWATRRKFKLMAASSQAASSSFCQHVLYYSSAISLLSIDFIKPFILSNHSDHPTMSFSMAGSLEMKHGSKLKFLHNQNLSSSFFKTCMNILVSIVFMLSSNAAKIGFFRGWHWFVETIVVTASRKLNAVITVCGGGSGQMGPWSVLSVSVLANISENK